MSRTQPPAPLPPDETPQDPERRRLLGTGLGVAGALLLGARESAAQAAEPTENVPGARAPRQGSAAATASGTASQRWMRPGVPGRDYLPVEVPNGSKLPWKIVGGVKVFHMVAEPVEHEFAPGLQATCWGYNGKVHGPTIEVVEGDRVRIYVTNRLPAATTVHWHGILLPNGMDGVGGLNQRAIPPGETFKYEFTIRQWGTNLYHSHHDEMTQIGMGLTGLFLSHPRRPSGPRVDRDFAILLHEWSVEIGTARPNPNEMTEFNVLTMNARAFPGTEPLVVRTGQRVRIRLGNLSPQNHHPIHLHGYQFRITQTDGGPIQPSAQIPETTVLVPVGSTRTIEFVADEPGDWALHCHMTHHMMNQMGHDAPNMVGVDTRGLARLVQPLLPGYMPMGQVGMAGMEKHMEQMPVPPNSIPMKGLQGKYDYITMGGMFTVLKVRDGIRTYEDPGWYDVPAGTLADRADPAELERDGIDPAAPQAPAAG
ncbi:multicopper oxidase family protein [Vulgatibacter sp.]|uniref:multicopper oxidase family protein n=1 Tax=Vulgatibacter sp. TaxID=1971226 RepID=UPI00356B3BDC